MIDRAIVISEETHVLAMHALIVPMHSHTVAPLTSHITSQPPLRPHIASHKAWNELA